MWKMLLPLLCLSTLSYSLPLIPYAQPKPSLGLYCGLLDEMVADLGSKPHVQLKSLDEIKNILNKEGVGLSKSVIDKVLTTIKCARNSVANYNPILTIIDYSLPSSEKRLWVFDLEKGKLLFHTYVSHGIKSGVTFTTYFSNKNNSKASSIGVYKTEKPYVGRHGLSLQLNGMDAGFNDNAANRAVVMHGGWYVEESFIKRYGRAGRSWGCPAIPDELTQSLISTIKDNSLFVMYYPSEAWFARSRFFKCDTTRASNEPSQTTANLNQENDTRDDVLLVNRSHFKRLDEAPVVAMEANTYERTFHHTPPVERMLRRQINHSEYIALSNSEFNSLVINNTPENMAALKEIKFIQPRVVMVRGYYETQMNPLELGAIKEVKLDSPSSDPSHPATHYSVLFEHNPAISLYSTDQFIRWVGL